MTTWHANAKCLGQPTAWFDYDNLPTTATLRDAAAKTLCRGCPVIDECRLDALEHWDVTRGHVVAGIPVPSTNTGRNAAHHRLALEAGIELSVARRGRPRARPLAANCSDCGRAMRGSRETISDRPGTVLHVGRGVCTNCHRAEKRAVSA